MDEDRIQREFISEAEEILDGLSADAMALEKAKGDPPPALVNKAFRGMHSLKGLAGMLKYTDISELSHAMEGLMDHLRMGRVPCSKAFVDLLYDGIAALHQLVAAAAEGGGGTVSLPPLLERLRTLVDAEKGGKEGSVSSAITLDPQALKSLTEYEEHRLKEAIVSSKGIFSIDVSFPFTTFDTDLRALNARLSERGEIISTLPSAAASPDALSFRLLVATQMDAETMSELAGPLAAIADLRSPAASEEASPGGDEAASAPESTLKSVSRSVRVDIGKLDGVMNIVGDLLLERTGLEQFQARLRDASVPRDMHQSLMKIERNLHRKLNDLQKGIIELRMVPVGQIYNKLTRAVHQLASESRKEVQLEFRGEETELDKMMIEEITDPLLHIIRNGVDHGIENPEERERAGKPRKGTITILAAQKGNSVSLSIRDDGHGIDLVRIRKLGATQGLIPAEATEEQVLDLIFLPGFSSAEEVSRTSGRGVGLDVVKQNIALLNGTIHVTTEKGRGTTFEIILPITLAIIQALVVEYQGVPFAVPLTSVDEAFRAREHEIQTIEGKEVFYLRDYTLPLVRLGDIFRMPRRATGDEWVYIVVNKIGDRSIGVVCDRLLRQQEIIIKSVGRRLKGIPGIAGAAELQAGELLLVLDVSSIMDLALLKFGSLREAKRAE
jgi:two-component system, chemotaxis family, sensor kinase CheA